MLEVGDVPPGVVTVMSTGPPEAWAGEIAVIFESLLTVNEVAGVPPKDTAVAPVNPDPLIVTVVPPFFVPDEGDEEVMTGP